MKRLRWSATVVLLGSVLTTGAASAAPISIDPGTVNNFRDTRSLNDVGVAQGDTNQFGADIVPSSGSSITGVQGGVTVGPVGCAPFAVNPNFCAVSPPFSASRLDAWSLTFANGPNTATIVTPTLAGAETPVPFPHTVTISGNGFTPTLSFSVPSGFTPDAIRINIFDKTVTLPNGANDVVHTQAIPANATSFQVPATLSSGQSLQEGRPYVLNIQLVDLRPGATEAAFLATNNNALILRRSSSFFDFTPLTSTAPPQLLLPTVGPDPNPNDNQGAPYQFNIGEVLAGRTIFVDPVLAIGYDFQIGPGDPNFASVILPNVGDGRFDVGFDQTVVSLLAGVQLFFPGDGVSQFSVRGIETSANLDPTNVTAFVTGLTFIADGHFTGTMTPITQFVPASVPEPATLLLVGSGLVAVIAGRRARRREDHRRRGGPRARCRPTSST